MILVLGVGIVGKAVIEYFLEQNKEICFFDDKTTKLPTYENVEFFNSKAQTWDKIEKVIISPGFALQHDIIQEAIRRKIEITNDIGLFFDQKRLGIKIGITGTNGKSSVCALLKHVLGDDAQIGGNFGISPLKFKESKFYIIELSSYQLELLDIEDLCNLEIGAIVNIFPNHLDRHGSFDDYASAKCRILRAKHKFLGHCDFFQDWELPKASIPDKLPNSKLFEKEEYKYAWGLIELILDNLKIDKNEAREKASSYEVLEYRQQIIRTDPITIINDSKSSNSIASIQALKNCEKAIVWIAGGAHSSHWSNFDKHQNKIKKVFISGQNQVELIDLCNNFKIPYENLENLEKTTQKALNFAIANKLDVLFSPGYPSFDQFDNFVHRGQKFNEYVENFFKDSSL